MSAPVIADLEHEIAELKDLKTPALQSKWRTVFGSEPPRKMRAGFLARAIVIPETGVCAGGCPY